ncbi:MAG: TerC/Alx family metal homeostasis membrane protein [Desulfovibrionaceae bacterium]|nr:TerC/Alx family metal homeostasis membrane protein [Desulfovibrionaceae bacterium]
MFGEHSLTEILIFFILIIFFLWLDLHAHRSDKPINIRDASIWTAIWIILSFIFAGYVGIEFGYEKAEQYITGYLLEKSLSLDNLFVIMAIFGSFAIKDELQHRVLYYGIVGALILRFLFITAGTALIAAFGPMALACFGIFILWTAWKMWQSIRTPQYEITDYSEHWSVRYTQRFFPIHNKMHGHDFFVRISENGKTLLKATPMFLCLVVVEVSDIMFALDSIPAIIAVAPDPYIIYTSNIFAILGLRSMYFTLAAASRYLRRLNLAVVGILFFVGMKMLLDVAGIVHCSPLTSLLVISGLLLAGIIASMRDD